MLELPSITECLKTSCGLVFCTECGEPVDNLGEIPNGAFVRLETGEKLWWCSEECITESTKRSRVGESR